MDEDIFRKEIIKTISDILGKSIDDSILEIPPDSKMGDYALPCFSFAKEMRKNPADIAKHIGDKIKPGKYISSVKIIGPYVNFFLVKEELSKRVLKNIFDQKQHYGSHKKNNKVILVESPGPNTNKPLHLGHVRNILLGNSIVNIYNFLGYDTKRVDIINDRGVHICKSMLAYELYGHNKEPDKKSDHFVGDFYVKYAIEAEKNPGFEVKIQELLNKWEKGDKETLKLWKKMSRWALDGFKITYDRYGVIMDKPYYESEHYLKGKEYVLEAYKKGLFDKDEKGNIIVDLSKEGLGKKVVLREDGTSIYITQDIALAKIRNDDYKMDKMIYVVGNEQIHHFQALFSIFRILKFPFAENCHHLAYGMIALPEGKMKSREGKVVDADNLADEMHEIAKKEVEKRYTDINKKEIESRAEAIGMGAIKFFILKFDPMKDFVFNPKESISFEGETGPYVQYSHARCSSILRKYGKKVTEDIDYSLLNSDEEKSIIRLLEDFPMIIEKAGEEYRPSLITRFLLDLSQAFNEYYHKYKTIQEDKELEKARILLIYCVKEVIETGLGLLGISAPDIM